MCRQIPIGAAHISFSGHTGLSKLPVGQPRVAPGGHRRLTSWTNTQRSTGPGGKIMMTLGRATPKGKEKGWVANGKTNVGHCWKSFKQGELSSGSHYDPRAARVEQNTRREAEPSTLHQVYRCIKITWQYIDIPISK